MVCRYTDDAVGARWFGQERGACRCIMRRHCGGRELDDHAEAGDFAVALEARSDDRAVEKDGPDAWATAGPRGDPLLAPRRDGVEFVGSLGKTNGWDASTSAKSKRVRWEVEHVATSGLAGVPETSCGKVSRFLQNRPRTRFRQFSQNCPREDCRRTLATSGRLRRVEANISKSSQPSDGLQCIFSGFAPKGLLVLFQHLGVL